MQFDFEMRWAIGLPDLGALIDRLHDYVWTEDEEQE